MKTGLAVLFAGLLLVGCSPEEAAPTTEPPVTTLSPTTTTTAPATTTAPPTSIVTTTSIETTTTTSGPAPVTEVEQFPIPGNRPHDVAVAPDGRVWYTAQRSGSLDRLDPSTAEVEQVPLGAGAAPHGVIVGPDGDAWVTDQGLNALVRVDHDTLAVDVFPASADVSMHTAAFAPDGMLWFTGQAGYVGRFDPATGQMDLFETGGGGPYGITVTPDGDVYYAALAGSYIARVDPATGEISRIDPPTSDQGARRVWTDTGGRIWVSYWNTGHLALYDPAAGSWQEWRLPGESPQAYAVYVDETDHPWVSDFGGNHALLRFDPAAETFESFELPTPGGEVRQILGRPGEVWGAESAADALVVVRYGN
jgi:virginiamycin B lyase